MPSAPRDAKSEPIPRLVLLVEDNPLIAMSTADQLREMGVEEVMLCASLADARAMCARHRFDFALLDFNLARGTSIELARDLRNADTPFAFATGFAGDVELPDDLANCRILSKPYLMSDLFAVLRGD
jgi:CheY-like chemotaxis protein